MLNLKQIYPRCFVQIIKFKLDKNLFKLQVKERLKYVLTVKKICMDLTIVGALIFNVLTKYVNSVQFPNFLKMAMKFFVKFVTLSKNLSMKVSWKF